MKHTGLLEAIDLIENSGTLNSFKMAIGKIKLEQGYIEQLQIKLDKHRWIPEQDDHKPKRGEYISIYWEHTKMVQNVFYNGVTGYSHWKPIILPKEGNDE